MAVATARKATNGKPGPKHNIDAARDELLRAASPSTT